MTDAQLLTGYRQTGDPRYAEVIVHRNSSRIRGTIYAIVLDDEEADDLTQEVFMKAFAGLEKFNHNAQLSTWLYSIAVNSAKDALRVRERNPI